MKDFRDSKQRLESTLSAAERHRLAEAMFWDVLQVLQSTDGLSQVAAVTKDETAVAIARPMNVLVIREVKNVGETAAVTLGAKTCIQANAEAMLVVPADIPLITKEDVEAVLHAGATADAVFVPSRDQRGTNAVLLRPPDAMPLRFGYDSFGPHLEAARRRKLRTTILRLPNIELDIDTPDDLAVFAARPAPTRTHALLEEIGWVITFR